MQPRIFPQPEFPDYALVDSGGGQKLERLGSVTVQRPDPQALWRPRLASNAWEAADLSFVFEKDSGGRGGHWVASKSAPRALRGADPEWDCSFAGATFRIRPTAFKHVGLFPEQAANWSYVARAQGAIGASGAERPRLLNLFGYSGAASVLAAQAGYEVTHVDASKTSITWAQDNAAASGIGRDSMRVICDDALAFAQREVRRGSKYNGILLDPPHYGRGPKGEKWQFEDSVLALIEAVGRLVAERSFVVLSTYAIGYSPIAFLNLLSEFEGGDVAAGELAIAEQTGGRLLPAGFCARWQRGLDGLDPAS